MPQLFSEHGKTDCENNNNSSENGNEIYITEVIGKRIFLFINPNPPSLSPRGWGFTWFAIYVSCQAFLGCASPYTHTHTHCKITMLRAYIVYLFIIYVSEYVNNDASKNDITAYWSYLLHYNSFYKYFNSCYDFSRVRFFLRQEYIFFTSWNKGCKYMQVETIQN